MMPPDTSPDSTSTHGKIVSVVAWNDPVVDTSGFPADHPYVEMFWLPVLGPTATWLLRRLAGGLVAAPQGYEIDTGDLARALGVSSAGGRSSPFGRAVHRCTMFGVAQHVSLTPLPVLAVRRVVPPVSRRHLERLPSSLTRVHRDWLSARV